MLIAAQSWSHNDTDYEHEEIYEPAILYQSLFNGIDDADIQREAISLLDENIHQLDLQACDLPVDPAQAMA